MESNRVNAHAIMDLPPSYEELFGRESIEPEVMEPEPEIREPEPEPEIKDWDTITMQEDVSEYHMLEEAEVRRLSYRQDRFLVTDTRASPPEAPHFLPPDLRPWMSPRNDPVSQSSGSESNSVRQSSSTHTRSDTSRAGGDTGRGDVGLNPLLRGNQDSRLQRPRTVEELINGYESGLRLRRDERRREQEFNLYNFRSRNTERSLLMPLLRTGERILSFIFD